MALWNKSTYNKELSDQELIQLYKESSDLSLLAQLYDRYMHLVYGVCLKYLDHDDSKDAVMQLFEKLIDSVKKHEISNFKSWLHVTSRNHCLMELRRRKKENHPISIDNNNVFDMESSHYLHHDTEDLLNGDIEIMKKCLEKLPEKQKECIELFYIQENSYQEVSKQSGYELKRVKSYIQNGKRNIKICIEKNRE